MHLLAISGLHVGILCAFLLSIFHLLIVRRGRALLLTAAVCVIYAMITDLRPSVLRATVFFVVLVVAQFVRVLDAGRPFSRRRMPPPAAGGARQPDEGKVARQNHCCHRALTLS